MWTNQRRHPVLFTDSTYWVFGLICVCIFVRWFNHLPYVCHIPIVNILFHLGWCRIHCIQESQRTYWTSWADLGIWWSQERIWGVWREESQSWRKFSACISEEKDYCDGKKAEERAKGRSRKTSPLARSTGMQPDISLYIEHAKIVHALTSVKCSDIQCLSS